MKFFRDILLIFCLATFLGCGASSSEEENKSQNVAHKSKSDSGAKGSAGAGGTDAHGHDHEKLAKELGLAEQGKSKGNLGFIHAYIASLSVIIVSELGDKTFFIAAIMAMRHSRCTVFTGALAALGLMTVLSAVLGFATTIIPRFVTYYVSTGLFAIFGLRMLKEGYNMSPDEGAEEYEEVQAEIKAKEDEMMKEDLVTEDIETGIIKVKRRKIFGLVSKVFLEAFTLTFLAEWGDRSQIATIILGAREDGFRDVMGVIIGGTMGHALCTGLAVMGGKLIAQRISVRTVTIAGGVVFLLFAITSLFIDPDAM
ncbi:unnamed protein product [Owenia fusiformis]|uniref:GDT1 family protein n=1 Tax=Owenia fusiformis TaxID=6347 RepID=A0A8J1TI63_OWEFU|nr:unnamed protein product [Owenia fusiformis]